MDDYKTGKSLSAQSRRDFIKSSVAAPAIVLGVLNVSSAGVYVAGSDVIRVGVIGCGGRGAGAAVDAMAADSGVRIVALADLFESRVREKMQLLKERNPKQVLVDNDHCFVGFDAYKHVIECSDVVLIACASKFHPFYVHSAVEAGKHVFVEKPPAIDPAGVKLLSEACELAKRKGLCVVSGLQSRYHHGYREAIQRVHDGAIGDIVAIEENFLRAPYGVVHRQPWMNELQFQLMNWYHFSWLSGDDVVQSLIHNLDRATWALREQAPVRAHGMGGRSAWFEEAAGNVFDHHSVVYEYANGVRVYAFCRTQVGCYNEVSSKIFGTKGVCYLTDMRIDGETKWRYEGPPCNPYLEEHKALFSAIRSGKPIVNDYMVRSTLVSIMGQIACYTGQRISWEQVEKSNFHYPPKPEECSFDMEPPVKPGRDGLYPVPIPGVTKLI
ncbi:MAG: hypothetical protein GDYSWBUE_000764 [Candidatus Fervidibacterota bacterium]